MRFQVLESLAQNPFKTCIIAQFRGTCKSQGNTFSRLCAKKIPPDTDLLASGDLGPGIDDRACEFDYEVG